MCVFRLWVQRQAQPTRAASQHHLQLPREYERTIDHAYRHVCLSTSVCVLCCGQVWADQLRDFTQEVRVCVCVCVCASIYVWMMCGCLCVCVCLCVCGHQLPAGGQQQREGQPVTHLSRLQQVRTERGRERGRKMKAPSTLANGHTHTHTWIRTPIQYIMHVLSVWGASLVCSRLFLTHTQ